VVVPRLDHVAFDHRRHFYEWRLADIDVPCAFLIFGLRHKALDTETLDRRDLVLDPGELGIDRRDTGMKVVNPLINRRRQQPFGGGAGRSDTRSCHGTDARQAEATDQTAREELTPVDRSLPKLLACCLAQDVFLFVSYAHPFPPHRSGVL